MTFDHDTGTEDASVVFGHALASPQGQAQLLDRLHDAILVRDVVDNAIRYWNQGAEAMYGWTRDEVLGRASHALLQTGFPRPLEEIQAELVRAGWWEGELAHTRRDGKQLIVASRWALQTDERGRPIATLEINTDVTERRRAEEARARLAAIVESSDDAIIGKTLAGTITSWNPAAERLYGYTGDDVIGQPISILIPPDRPDELPGILARLRRGERIDHYETERVAKDGRRVHVSLSISPVADGDGRIIGAATIARDVTERIRAEPERARAAETQRLLADAGALLASSLDYEATLRSVVRLAVPVLADLCIVDILEEDGSIRRMAAAHVDPVKEELVREMRRRYPPDPNGPQPFLAALRTGRSQLVPEFSDALVEAVARDAEHLRILRSLNYTSAIAVPLVARERTLGAITLLFAESERRYGPADLPVAEELARRAALAVDNARLYGEAQQAIRLRDEFLSVAAHELKTPITSLKGMAQVALRRLDREGRLEPQLARRVLGTIERQSDKLGRLVSQLLDISRIQAGQLAISPQVVDLGRVAEDAVAVAQASTTRHQIMLDAPSTIEARADPLRLEQVLLNLLDNAVRYSPDGGRIDVGLYPVDAQTARVEVRDRGLGIPPQQRHRIFDRFFQAHRGSHLGGIGLGLSISRQIIELHGGRIEADFPDDGGTRFIVTLPTGL